MATQALIDLARRDQRLAVPGRAIDTTAQRRRTRAIRTGERVGGVGWRSLPLSASVNNLRRLLRAQSRIESRIVVLHWLVMILVGAGALLPAHIGSGLGAAQSALV